MSTSLIAQKTYHMPKTTYVEKIDDQYLVISPDTANWILAENKDQLKIYKEFSSGKSVIIEALYCPLLHLFSIFSYK